MAAAPPVLPAPAWGGSVERRPEGPAGRASSLLATATRLRMVALHSSSFSAAGGKSRSSCARAKASASVGGGTRNFYFLFAPMSTYLRDLAQFLGRYGGLLKIRFGFKGFRTHK